MIVIGLGTGRSGTASLANLLTAQHDAHCFHEMNPSCVRFFGTPRPILNAIDEWQTVLDGGDPSMVTVDLGRPVAAKAYNKLCQMPRVRLIGDVAFYYLSYVETIAAHNPNVRFLCLRRDIDETVESWIEKSRIPRWFSKSVADRLGAWLTRTPYYKSRNFWMEHDGSRWQKDPLWDKCFPHFEAAFKRDAIRKYCEYYYEEADRKVAKLKGIFRFVPVDRLNDHRYQSDILSFAGIPIEEQRFANVHIHQSKRLIRPRTSVPYSASAAGASATQV